MCSKCNPHKYKINELHHTLKVALRRNGKICSKHTLELMGLSSWEQFEAYWQRKIAAWNSLHPEMPIGVSSGDYEIDHIKPRRAFDDNWDDVAECSHYTNLQPLPRRVNVAKGDLWQFEDERHWRWNIIYMDIPDAGINVEPYMPVAFSMDAV